MRVIFLADVPGSGTAGEVKDIKNGYARNYLLPKRLAIVANHDQLQRLEAIRKAGEEHRIHEASDLSTLAEQLSQITVSLSARVGPTGRFYGSVTSSQIAEELQHLTERDFDRRTITINTPIEEPGEYEATIHFPQGITAAVKVLVAGQDVYGRIVGMPTEDASASSDENETVDENAQLAAVSGTSDETQTTEDDTQLAAIAEASDETQTTEDDTQLAAVAKTSDETQTTEDDTQLAAIAEASDETQATEDGTQPSSVAQVSEEAESTEDDTQPSGVAQVSEEAETTEDDNQEAKNETDTHS